MKFAVALEKWLIEKSTPGRLFLHDQLSEAAGIAPRRALDIMTGKREPGWVEAMYIAHAFGTSLEDFLIGPEKPERERNRWEQREMREADRELVNEAMGKPVSAKEEARRKRLREKLFSGYLDA